MKRWLRIVRSKPFLYTYLAVAALILAGLSLNAAHSLRLRGQERAQLGREQLAALERDVSACLGQVEDFTVKAASLPSVTPLLHDTARAGIEDYVRLKKDVENFHVPSAFFHSVSFLFSLSGTVYSSDLGLYDLADYYDKDFILGELLPSEQAAFWSYRREWPECYVTQLTSRPVTYVRRIPIISSYPVGAVIVHLDGSFLHDAVTNLSSGGLRNVLIWSGDELLYAADTFAAQEAAKLPALWEQTSAHLDGVSYEVLTEYDFTHGLRYAALCDATPTPAEVRDALRPLPAALAGFLAAGFLLSMAVVYGLTHPIWKLVGKLRETGLALEEKPVRDEYRLIDTALDGLISTNRRFTQIMAENRERLRDKLVLDLIWGSVDELAEALRELDFDFPEAYCVVFLVQIGPPDEETGYSAREQARLYVRELAAERFAALGPVRGALLEEDKLVFLLSTDLVLEEDSRARDICADIARLAREELHAPVLFSFGSRERDPALLYRSYTYAKHLLTYLSEYDREPFGFFTADADIPIYDHLLHREIVEELTGHDYQRLRDTLDRALGELLEERPGRRKSVILFATSIYSGLLESGLVVSPGTLNDCLGAIASAPDAESLRQALHRFVSQIVFQQAGEETEGGDRNVSAALKYITEHYDRDLSVTDVADEVHLNAVYLNRLFKGATGKTIYEYLNRTRIERAKELLLQNGLSIARISEQVGYNDVRSFVRYFKKFEGMSPSDFRTAK